MKTLRLKKKASALALVILGAYWAVVPSANGQTTPLCDGGNPTTASGSTPGCAVTVFPAGAYAYPKLNWQQIGFLDSVPASGPAQSLSGSRLTVSNNRSASAANLTADKVADVLALYSTNAPIVVARYNPMSAELRIELFKVEKVGNRQAVLRAAYAPAHGRAFAASMTYATETERQTRTGPSFNPFELFASSADDAFHNMVGLNAVQVAVGHAMQAGSAALGLVAIADIRVEQWKTESGGWFRKTVTQHTKGWGKPLWHVATPTVLQRGDTAFMCAINVAQPTDCPPSRVIHSGISWKAWTNSSLPTFESEISYSTKSKSGWTLLTFVLLGFPGAIQTATMGGLGMSGGAGLGDVVDVGDVVVLERPLQGASSGFGPGMTATDEEQQKVIDGMHANFDTPTVESTGVRAVAQAAFGTCAPGATIASCGGPSGVLPRSDSLVQHNTTEFWRDNGNPLVESSSIIAN
jgi:hypothetical protein